MRIVADIMAYTAKSMPKFNSISVSGYHMQEAGADCKLELAFTLADGLAYIEAVVSRGKLTVDDFGHRLSFFFDIHNDFFEEIAKLRAARRLWATLVRERYGAKKDESCRLRMHGQTAGVSLTAQQPLNNIVRVTLQALAGVLGGVQSLHTNSYDETFALPTEDAVTLALRTQQIIAEESGVANIVDPLGGSYAIEALTDEIETAARSLIDEIDARGGMIAAIDEGFPQTEISESAWKTQREIDLGERITVGVNGYRSETGQDLKILRIPPDLEKTQIRRVQEFKTSRDPRAVQEALQAVRCAAEGDQNLMPHLVHAVEVGCSVGEISDIYRDVFGEYRDPGHL